MANKLQLKRVFSHADEQDGSRFIVETAVAARRGQIRIGRRCMARRACAKPRTVPMLHHDPKCWNEFRRRFFAELRHYMDALSPILEAAQGHGDAALHLP